MTRPDFQLEYQKRKVATKLIPYERYGEILFQKVASGYLLPFCTGWILKKRIIKFVVLRKCKKTKILKISVFISPLTPDRPPYFAALGFHGWPINTGRRLAQFTLVHIGPASAHGSEGSGGIVNMHVLFT